jgi:hypothetical protein
MLDFLRENQSVYAISWKQVETGENSVLIYDPMFVIPDYKATEKDVILINGDTYTLYTPFAISQIDTDFYLKKISPLWEKFIAMQEYLEETFGVWKEIVITREGMEVRNY